MLLALPDCAKCGFSGYSVKSAHIYAHLKIIFLTFNLVSPYLPIAITYRELGDFQPSSKNPDSKFIRVLGALRECQGVKRRF
jgi:hypothetical protein